jgi:hypothetical protein
VNREDLTPYEKKRIEGMFNVLQYCKLTPRQESIVDSMREQFLVREVLTDKQRILLSDIYERAETYGRKYH